MNATYDDLVNAIESLNLAGKPVCVHASLRSFGNLEGGADALVTAFLAARCTLLVPTFSWSYAIPPPADQRLSRNGWDYDAYAGPTTGLNRVYTPTTPDLDREMGVIPAAVLAQPEAVRGNHPICSFTALGPLAADLIAPQGPVSVFAPLAALTRLDGAVLLMGVGLKRMTFLHYAEQVAGRTPFRRWANDAQGEPMAVEVGGCSEGFEQFAPFLESLGRMWFVGRSAWICYPSRATLEQAVAAIRRDPRVTRCPVSECTRCQDAIAGGPILPDAH